MCRKHNHFLTNHAIVVLMRHRLCRLTYTILNYVSMLHSDSLASLIFIIISYNAFQQKVEGRVYLDSTIKSKQFKYLLTVSVTTPSESSSNVSSVWQIMQCKPVCINVVSLISLYDCLHIQTNGKDKIERTITLPKKRG